MKSRSFRALAVALGLCTLPLAAQIAHADMNDAGSTPVTKPMNGQVKAVGLKTAVVAATDTGGDEEVALRALKAANIALARTRGYVIIPADRVAKTLQENGTRWPFLPRDYPNIKKKLDKADRVLAVTVSPVSGANPTYSALVELYDLNTGGLVGRGEGTYTAGADSRPLVGNTVTTTTDTTALTGSFAVPAGTAPAPVSDVMAPTTTTVTTEAATETDSRFLAVDGAILHAVEQMNEPATLNGIIVSLPGGYTARLSKGLMHGLRNGARVEYTFRGQTIAYGSIVDVGKGESIATVAPERAFPLLSINGEFHTVSNPVAGAMGKSRDEIEDREFSKFEKEFGLGAGLAGLAYLLFTL
jgi:hypothetical protein